jgi:hypothetical protein
MSEKVILELAIDLQAFKILHAAREILLIMVDLRVFKIWFEDIFTLRK